MICKGHNPPSPVLHYELKEFKTPSVTETVILFCQIIVKLNRTFSKRGLMCHDITWQIE